MQPFDVLPFKMSRNGIFRRRPVRLKTSVTELGRTFMIRLVTWSVGVVISVTQLSRSWMSWNVSIGESPPEQKLVLVRISRRPTAAA